MPVVSATDDQDLVLKLVFFEGALVREVHGRVIKRGVDGPAGKGRYWIVETPPTAYVRDRPPARYLIIGAAGRRERLEVLDEGEFRDVGCQMMLDETGRAPDIQDFDFKTAYDFGRGVAELAG
jgi:hypothetical protein